MTTVLQYIMEEISSTPVSCADCGKSIQLFDEDNEGDECWHYDDEHGCHWLCIACWKKNHGPTKGVYIHSVI